MSKNVFHFDTFLSKIIKNIQFISLKQPLPLFNDNFSKFAYYVDTILSEITKDHLFILQKQPHPLSIHDFPRIYFNSKKSFPPKFKMKDSTVKCTKIFLIEKLYKNFVRNCKTTISKKLDKYFA